MRFRVRLRDWLMVRVSVKVKVRITVNVGKLTKSDGRSRGCTEI